MDKSLNFKRRFKTMRKIFDEFGDCIKDKFEFLGTANPEDQLKICVSNLLESFGNQFNQNVSTHTEVQMSEYHIRPDIGVNIDKLVCGFIELKAPGVGSNPTSSKRKHDKDQWNKAEMPS